MTIKRTLILITLLIITGVLTCGFLLQSQEENFEMKIASLGDSSN